jgi:hypothetical protein
MLAVLALSLLVPATAPAKPAVHDDPPIRLKLSDDVFDRGERARVRVKLAQDGYLVVLRADAEGRIRVLYPLNPEDQTTVRGGREFEVRSRGDREAFTVDDREGSGTVLAARSGTPFNFDEFARDAHWDYRALVAEKADEDGEATLVDLVDRMTSGNYDYDVATYTVTGRAPGRYSAAWYGPWYSGWYAPCFGCYPFYGPRFGFGATIVFGRSHFYHRRRW